MNSKSLKLILCSLLLASGLKCYFKCDTCAFTDETQERVIKHIIETHITNKLDNPIQPIQHVGVGLFHCDCCHKNVSYATVPDEINNAKPDHANTHVVETND